jgi:hypothetical protein
MPCRRTHSVGSPRFLVDLSVSAAPNHPGEPDRCTCSLLDGRYQASALSEAWPLPTSRHEAESGSLTMRPAPSSHWAPNAGSPRHPPARLHGERAITMVSSFQPTRSTRLQPGAPKTRKVRTLGRRFGELSRHVIETIHVEYRELAQGVFVFHCSNLTP